MSVYQEKEIDAEITLVTFGVGHLQCGLPIDEVEEIKRVFSITRVHRAPPHICGVVNIRGQIVTVIDLKKQLKIESDDLPIQHKLVIIRREKEQIGLLVDSIDDTISTTTSALSGPPAHLDASMGDYIRQVCTTADALIVILDKSSIVDTRIVSEGELPE